MLVVLYGPPAAGKTTLADSLARRLRPGHPVRRLSSDAFASRTYERMAERVARAPAADWIVDGTFHREEHRRPFRGTDWRMRWVLVRAPLDTCLRRDHERDGIGEAGVRSVYAALFDSDTDIDPDFVLDTDVVGTETALDLLEQRAREWLGISQ